MKTSTTLPPTGEPLPPFRKVIDGYWIYARSKSILCGNVFHPLEAEDYMLTPYHAEAHKLYERGWLEYVVIEAGATRYKLSKAGEDVRELIYDD